MCLGSLIKLLCAFNCYIYTHCPPSPSLSLLSQRPEVYISTHPPCPLSVMWTRSFWTSFDNTIQSHAESKYVIKNTNCFTHLHQLLRDLGHLSEQHNNTCYIFDQPRARGIFQSHFTLITNSIFSSCGLSPLIFFQTTWRPSEQPYQPYTTLPESVWGS